MMSLIFFETQCSIYVVYVVVKAKHLKLYNIVFVSFQH